MFLSSYPLQARHAHLSYGMTTPRSRSP